METGVRIMWPPARAEVVRAGKDTLPLYTQPQAGCQPMRQVVATSGEQRVGAVSRIRTGTIKPVYAHWLSAQGCQRCVTSVVPP